MPEPHPYNDIAVLTGFDDFTPAEGTIECAAIGKGVVILGLSNGCIQVVGGPNELRQTVFMIPCLAGGRVERLEVVDRKEAILSVESCFDADGESCVVLYQFTEQLFKGDIITHTLPVSGGNITAVSPCKYTDRLAVATRHIITIYTLLPDPQGGDNAMPFAEVHVPVSLSHISLLGTTVAYGSNEVMWCISIQDHDTVVDQSEEQTPLASGATQASLSDSYIELRFDKKVQSPTASASNSAAGSDTASSARRLFGLFGSSSSVTGASPSRPVTPKHTAGRLPPKKSSMQVTFVHSDGSENCITKWDARSTREVTGAFNHTDHPVYFLTPTQSTCKLLYKKRTSSAEGEFKHFALSPNTTGSSATEQDTRLLIVTTNKGSIVQLMGGPMGDYAFNSPCRHCTSNEMFLFVYTQGGAVDVYPLRGRAPMEGLQSANGCPWKSPFSKMTCSEVSLFMLHAPYSLHHPTHEETDPRGSWGTNAGSGSGGGSPNILGIGRMRATSAASSASSTPGIIVTSAARENHFGTGCCNGSICKITTAPELMQEILKEYKRRAFIDESLSIPILHEGYLALQGKVSCLKLAAASLDNINVSSLSIQLELDNAMSLAESVASVLGDIYLKLELVKPKPSDSPMSPETTASSRSGWSAHNSVGDGLSERDTHSVHEGSCGDAPLTGTWDEALTLSLNRDPRGSLPPSNAHSNDKRSWAFYAFSDRTFRQALHMLRKDQWSLLSYLEYTLFDDQRPKAIASSNKLFVPEELGNSILAVYAKMMPHKLCSVVWDSWLGRAKGGTACFTAGNAGRLLREGLTKNSGTSPSRRQSLSKTTEVSTVSYDKDVEEVVRVEGLTSSWRCINPKEQFVLGLLLLEDGDIRGCVEALSNVEGSALVQLASSSPHLWEPDVGKDDTDTAPLVMPTTPTIPSLIETVKQTRAAQPFKTFTMGSLIALYFPWYLLPILVAARDKFTLPITSAVRLINMASHQSGLLLSKFLTYCIISKDPSVPDDIALRSFAACHLLNEVVTYMHKCQERVDVLLDTGSSQGSPPQEGWLRGLNIGETPKLPRLGEFIKMMESEVGLGNVGGFGPRPPWMEGLAGDGNGEISGTAEEGLWYSVQTLQSLLWMCNVYEEVWEGILASVKGGGELGGNPYVVSFAVVVLLKLSRIPDALVLVGPLLPASRMLSFAMTHCGTSPVCWKAYIDHLVATNNRPLLTLMLSKLATTLPLESFVKVLPPNGNTRFFLPFITAAIDTHKTTLLQDSILNDS